MADKEPTKLGIPEFGNSEIRNSRIRKFGNSEIRKFRISAVVSKNSLTRPNLQWPLLLVRPLSLPHPKDGPFATINSSPLARTANNNLACWHPTLPPLHAMIVSRLDAKFLPLSIVRQYSHHFVMI